MSSKKSLLTKLIFFELEKSGRNLEEKHKSRGEKMACSKLWSGLVVNSLKNHRYVYSNFHSSSSVRRLHYSKELNSVSGKNAFLVLHLSAVLH